MADVVLITITSVFGVLVLLSCIYFVVYFQHPDDKWVAWGPKVVVVVGLALCCFNVLILPLDIANQGGQLNAIGGLPMDQITIILFILTTIMAIAVVPFMMYYYEGVDETDEYQNDPFKQVLYAIQWSFVTLVIFFMACTILWFFIGYADFEMTEMISPMISTTSVLSNDFCSSVGDISTSCSLTENVKEQVKVSYTMYMIAIASFIGWVMFSIFGGVGLAALPFDLLLEYKHRPRPIKLEEYTQKKRIIGEEAALLLRESNDISEKMKNSGKKSLASKKVRKLKRSENEFKRNVMFLESQYQKLEDSYRHGGGNPLVYWFKLFVGSLGSILSLMWFIHILIYCLPIALGQLPVSSFLNVIMEGTSDIPLIGISMYGLFSFWLMLCVMKGTLKMGVRFLCITIHPVKMGETMMSSLVFNVGLMLFSSMAVTQFCSYAFAEYARYTAAVSIFGSQLQNLRYITYVYSVLIFVLPIMTVLTQLYIWIKPYDTQRPIV